MSNWTARATALFLETAHPATDKTDETPFLSVLSVPTRTIYETPVRVSSVLSVGGGAIFKNRILAADLLQAAMKVCDEHGDGESARDEMRQQCLALPPHLQKELLALFSGTRPNDLKD